MILSHLAIDFTTPFALAEYTGVIKDVRGRTPINTWVFLNIFPKSVWATIAASIGIGIVVNMYIKDGRKFFRQGIEKPIAQFTALMLSTEVRN